MTAGDMQGFPKRQEIIAYILAILPLFISFSSITTVNGQVTSYADYADVVLGAILLVVNFKCMAYINQGEPQYKVIRIILTVILFGLAVLYIAQGLGLLVNLPPPLGWA